MIEPYIRPFYQKILGDPLAIFLGKWVSPNHITFLSVLVGFAFIPALLYEEIGLAFVFLCLSGILDTLDGTVARLFEKASPYGTALDIIGDRLVEVCVILGFFLVSPETRAFDCLFMLGSILICVTSFLVVGIFSENQSHKSFHYSSGLMERPEAFVFFMALLFFPNLFHLLSWVFSILVLLTAFLRIREFKQHLL